MNFPGVVGKSNMYSVNNTYIHQPSIVPYQQAQGASFPVALQTSSIDQLDISTRNQILAKQNEGKILTEND